ncbi:hypothetical protein [Nonomuraea wenchangensis]|uniref:hypothetical protein n=1 Tax=Nonomuraea wenchangensis TaxID=568860 RepID=UPI00331B7B7A
MTTWTQDYPALPDSSLAAARCARALVEQFDPARSDDGYKVVEELFRVALARCSLGGTVNLKAMADRTPRGPRLRFELHFPDDANSPEPPEAHQALSALADAYGERRSRDGRLAYAEIWGWR